MAESSTASIDRHLGAEIRSALEQRFWRPVEDGSTLEALADADEFGPAGTHPALFADHGVVHVRDIAAGVVDLATTVEGVLLPRRPDDRREFVVGLGVLLTYVHDVGMHDPTPAGRRIHALYAAHLPFSGAMDDVLERLVDDAGPVVRRIAAVTRSHRSASLPTSFCGSSSPSRPRTASRPSPQPCSPTAPGCGG